MNSTMVHKPMTARHQQHKKRKVALTLLLPYYKALLQHIVYSYCLVATVSKSVSAPLGCEFHVRTNTHHTTSLSSLSTPPSTKRISMSTLTHGAVATMVRNERQASTLQPTVQMVQVRRIFNNRFRVNSLCLAVLAHRPMTISHDISISR